MEHLERLIPLVVLLWLLAKTVGGLGSFNPDTVIVAQKIAATLASTGTPSHFLHPVEAVHGDLGRLRKDDLLLLDMYAGVEHLGRATVDFVDAMLVVFACFYPNRQMDFLLFFVLPVRVRPKHLVLLLLSFDLVGLGLDEEADADAGAAEFVHCARE